MPSGLISRNITIAGRRTSVRLEPAMWEALHDICLREGLTVNEMCSRVAERRHGTSLTAALRVSILTYFRAATRDHEARSRWAHSRRSNPSRLVPPPRLVG